MRGSGAQKYVTLSPGRAQESIVFYRTHNFSCKNIQPSSKVSIACFFFNDESALAGFLLVFPNQCWAGQGGGSFQRTSQSLFENESVTSPTLGSPAGGGGWKENWMFSTRNLIHIN